MRSTTVSVVVRLLCAAVTTRRVKWRRHIAISSDSVCNITTIHNVSIVVTIRVIRVVSVIHVVVGSSVVKSSGVSCVVRARHRREATTVTSAAADFLRLQEVLAI